MATGAVSANRLEILQIANAVASEKSIDKRIVLEAMEEAGEEAVVLQEDAGALGGALGVLVKDGDGLFVHLVGEAGEHGEAGLAKGGMALLVAKPGGAGVEDAAVLHIEEAGLIDELGFAQSDVHGDLIAIEAGGGFGDVPDALGELLQSACGADDDAVGREVAALQRHVLVGAGVLSRIDQPAEEEVSHVAKASGYATRVPPARRRPLGPGRSQRPGQRATEHGGGPVWLGDDERCGPAGRRRRTTAA